MNATADRIAGVILGTAVGDALGVPYENLSRRRVRRWLGDRPLAHRFLFGRGMVSDDTEHTCMVGQALLRAPHDPEAFARALAWRLRFWLLSAPPGLGFATLRATIKLCLGFPPRRSGVFSAGNGPAMRAALLGVYLGHDPPRLSAYLRASTRITHTDPKAERGALLVALAAAHGAAGLPLNDPRATLAALRRQLPAPDPELNGLLDRIDEHLTRAAPAEALADTLGLRRGITGYMYHTVPLALYCWLRHPHDFCGALEEVIALGGDTDTTGAIVGGLAGATVGVSGIPDAWLAGLAEWPLSVSWMRRLAAALAEPGGVQHPRLCWPAALPRNLFFFAVVLGHLARRCLPPY